MTRPTVVVLLKEPRPGRVKTRLASEIGTIPACWWFRHQVSRLLREIRDPRWRLVLAVAPDGAITSRAWPADLPRLAQGGGDLGARMGRVLKSTGPGPRLLIGADIPGLTRAHIRRGFEALKGHGAVLGPAVDGGFWLIGLKGPVPRGLFGTVRWSSEYAMQDTIQSMPDRVQPGFCDTMADVDRAADL